MWAECVRGRVQKLLCPVECRVLTDFGLALGVGGRFWAGDPSKYKECYVTVTIHHIFDMADGFTSCDLFKPHEQCKPRGRYSSRSNYFSS